jgi:S1-C subfamily serine protease
MSQYNSFFTLNKSKAQLVFALLVLIILAASLIFFALSLGKPYMGLTLSKGTHDWTVTVVDTICLASDAGIKPGDIPVEINNQPAQVFLGKYGMEPVNSTTCCN